MKIKVDVSYTKTGNIFVEVPDGADFDKQHDVITQAILDEDYETEDEIEVDIHCINWD
jgi:hypothetical protein